MQWRVNRVKLQYIELLLQKGDTTFHNIEVGPALKANESILDIQTIKFGEHHLHANRYIADVYCMLCFVHNTVGKSIISIVSHSTGTITLTGHDGCSCRHNLA